MAYTLVNAAPSLKVLDPNTVLQTERCSIVTQPTGIQATYEVPLTSFQTDAGAALLEVLAGALESLASGHHVTGGLSAQDFDQNGLLTDYVDLIVTYDRGIAGAPLLTGTARVPVDDFFLTETGIGGLQITPASGETPAARCDDVYNSLANVAGG